MCAWSNNKCKFVLHRAWMVEWCKFFFENKTDWEHIIYIIEVEISQRAKPLTLNNGELYIMGQDNKLKRCLTIRET